MEWHDHMEPLVERQRIPNKVAARDRHRALSFDEAMKFEHHHSSQRLAPVEVPELGH